MTNIQSSAQDAGSFRSGAYPNNPTENNSSKGSSVASSQIKSTSNEFENGSLITEVTLSMTLQKALGMSSSKKLSSRKLSDAKPSNFPESMKSISMQIPEQSRNISNNDDLDLDDLDFDDFEGDLDFSGELNDWGGILGSLGAMQVSRLGLLSKEFNPDFYLNMMRFLNIVLEGMLRFKTLNDEEEFMLIKIKQLQKKLLRLWTRMLQDRPRRRKRNFYKEIYDDVEEVNLNPVISF